MKCKCRLDSARNAERYGLTARRPGSTAGGGSSRHHWPRREPEPVAPGIKQNADRIAGKIKHTPGQGTEKVPVWGYCYLPIISSYSLNLLHCSVIMRMSARA